MADQLEGETVYEPFALMLQFALEPLLLPIGGTAASPQSLSIVAKMLRTLKRTNDVSPDPKTHNMCAAGRNVLHCQSAATLFLHQSAAATRLVQGCCCLLLLPYRKLMV